MRALSLLGFVLLLSCGDVPELPRPFHRGRLPAPSELNLAVRDSILEVSWEMPEQADVRKFLVSVSDTSGFSVEMFVDTTYFEVVVPGGSVYYVQVMPVGADLFVGPAVTDSVSLPYPLR